MTWTSGGAYIEPAFTSHLGGGSGDGAWNVWAIFHGSPFFAGPVVFS